MSLLKSSGLFVVNQDDTNYAISTDVLKEYIAPLAKQELGDPYDPGQPGLVMPGDGFVYDETTGLLEINIPSGIVYVGLIGSDDVNGETLEPDPYGEVPGHFYIVAEELTLCNDVWPGITNDPSGCVDLNINDKIIMNNDEEWDIIPAITEDFIHVGPTPPNDPDEGNLWWETESGNDQLYIWVLDSYGNGEWNPVSSSVDVSDTPPSNPSAGDLWWDSSPESLTLFVYEGTAWVPAAPPVSLDGINATIDSALIVQNELLSRVTAGETAQTSLQGTVSSALETQQGIQEDILTLQQELDALENTRYVGTWNAIDDDSKNGRTPGEGNFYFNQGGLATDWNLVGWLYITDVDSNGVNFTHSDIQVGDQIEVISKTENSYGIYTIQSTSDAGDYIAIQIEGLNRSDGVPAVGPHLIKIFSIDNGIDLGDADSRYMKLRGNQQLDKDVTWRIRQDALDDTGNTFISIKDGEMNLYHVADPGADTHAANQKYVKEQDDLVKGYVDTEIGNIVIPDVSDYLPLTGGSMTGGIEVDRESGAGLELKKEGTSNLKLWVDGGITTSKTTFNDDQLVTKDYVDTEISNIDIPEVDLSNYLQKSGGTMTGELKIDRPSAYNHLLIKNGGTNAFKVGNFNDEARVTVYNGQVFKVVGYVDDTLTQLFGVSNTGRVTLSNVRTPTADRDAATKAYVDSLLAAPARLSWKWDSTSSGDSAPGTGAFKYTQNGSDYYYRFSLETAEGIKLGESIISEFNRSIDNGPVGTIWYKEANGWKFKQQFRINTFRWNFNNHFEFRVTSRNGSTSFTPGTPYHITVGGFF